MPNEVIWLLHLVGGYNSPNTVEIWLITGELDLLYCPTKNIYGEIWRLQKIIHSDCQKSFFKEFGKCA